MSAVLRNRWAVPIGFSEANRCSRRSPTSSEFPTCVSAFCSRWVCWPSTVWAAHSHPGRQRRAAAQFFDQQSGSRLGLVDLFSGGNLRRLTIFALGIMPYITASIIFQLLTVVYEPLARLQKEGELGGARSPSGPAT